MPFSRLFSHFAALALASTLIAAAHATPINVINGSFEQTLTNTPSQFGSNYASQQVTGWTSQGYNFVYLPGTADTTGAAGQYGQTYLWGTGNGGLNTITASPSGGNFLAMDGAYEQGPLSQTLTGLQVGGTTTVTFSFAGAQQYGYTGITTEQFAVSLGNQTDYTDVLTDASHGFTGWEQENLTFTPTSATETLSFLAIGTPGGEPPFSLLDGVSVDSAQSPVPEPASISLMLTGLAGLGGYARKRLTRS